LRNGLTAERIVQVRAVPAVDSGREHAFGAFRLGVIGG